MTTTEIGQRAEQAAANYLAAHGYKILARNWNIPKLCEIDIIAAKDRRLAFVEVKYRKDDKAGGGLLAISRTKLQHMRRAAQIWVADHNFRGSFDLAAIEVSGSNFTVGSFVDSIY